MQLKILTFNIWDLHIGFVKDRQLRFEKIIQKLLDLDADIVCLQESWDPEHQYKLREKLTPKYHTTLGSGEIKTRRVLWKKFDTTGGLVILSKFPIENCQFTQFTSWPNTSLIEFTAKKGFLSATLDAPSGPLKIITTHLQAIHGKPDNSIQERQFKELISGANQSPQKIPLIIAGDFNKDKMMSDPFYAKIISDSGFAKPIYFNGPEKIPTHRTKSENIYAGTWLHPAKLPLQFDYFLMKGFNNLENVKIEPLYFEPPLSDHDPLLLTVSL